MAKTKLRTNYQDGEELLAYDVNLITETINTLNDSDDSHTQEIDDISNEITQINSDIEGIKDRLDTAEGNISQLQSDVNIINNTTIPALQDKDSEQDGRLDQLEQQLDDFHDEYDREIQAIEDDLLLTKGDVTTLTQEVEGLESSKQNTLTAGSNVTITNDTISSNQIDDTQNSSTKTWSSSKIASEIADAGFEVQIVQSLPQSGENHTIYFVPASDTGETNYYDEFMWVDGAWEKIGSTEIDLSNYYTRDEAATTAEINALFA